MWSAVTFSLFRGDIGSYVTNPKIAYQEVLPDSGNACII
jgi:hypothetical protein